MIDVEKWRECRVRYVQTKFGTEPGENAGDCLRAAIATTLQIDPSELRHWANTDDEDWADAVHEDLAAHGYEMYPVPFPTDIDPVLEPDGPVILVGYTPRGCAHAVVGCMDGTLLHDPLPDGQGLERMEQVWVITRPDDTLTVTVNDEMWEIRFAVDALARVGAA